MQVSVTYLDWPKFIELTEGGFEDRYWQYADSDDGKVPGVIAIDQQDDTSDSHLLWQSAYEAFIKATPDGSAWKVFADHSFSSMNDGIPSPVNDLGEPVDPELFAAIFSPESVREIVAMTTKTSRPHVADAELHDEIGRWLRIWTTAANCGLGIAYQLG